jgi:hypothetical protein
MAALLLSGRCGSGKRPLAVKDRFNGRDSSSCPIVLKNNKNPNRALVLRNLIRLDIFIADIGSLANQYFTLYSTKEFFNTIAPLWAFGEGHLSTHLCFSSSRKCEVTNLPD